MSTSAARRPVSLQPTPSADHLPHLRAAFYRFCRDVARCAGLVLNLPGTLLHSSVPDSVGRWGCCGRCLPPLSVVLCLPALWHIHYFILVDLGLAGDADIILHSCLPDLLNRPANFPRRVPDIADLRELILRSVGSEALFDADADILTADDHVLHGDGHGRRDDAPTGR